MRRSTVNYLHFFLFLGWAFSASRETTTSLGNTFYITHKNMLYKFTQTLLLLFHLCFSFFGTLLMFKIFICFKLKQALLIINKYSKKTNLLPIFKPFNTRNVILYKITFPFLDFRLFFVIIIIINWLNIFIHCEKNHEKLFSKMHLFYFVDNLCLYYIFVCLNLKRVFLIKMISSSEEA